MQDNIVFENNNQFAQLYQIDNPTSVHTLVQLPHFSQSPELQVFKKRARSKWYTQQIVRELAKLHSPLKSYYENSLDCTSVLIQKGQKITSKYCNARCCNTCNRIRTAKALKNYESQFKEIPVLYLTTLTTKNVEGIDLRKEIEKQLKSMHNISAWMKRNGIVWNGLRKIEQTYNEVENTYHPHLHILHEGNIGNIVIEQWMKRNPNTNIKGQDTRIANKETLTEIFKYTTKVFVKDIYDKKTMNVYLQAIDTMMVAMKDKRTWQPFGNIKRISEDVEELKSEDFKILDEDYNTYHVWEKHTWFDIINEEPFVDYKPPDINFNFIE